MPRHLRLLPALAVVLSTALPGFRELSLAVASARAEAPSGEEKKRAAAIFDRGVGLFNQAEFEQAARAFLDADRVAPSSQAITNAIAAARRAGAHLLVAEAAQRAIARDDPAAPAARAALADAATRLARLELRCDSTPCAVSIDGAIVDASVTYLLPGDHRLHATGGHASSDEKALSCVAGATYRVLLHPVPIEASAPPPRALPPPATSAGWPKAVFFAGAGATAVLTGLTIWSGVDAIQARDALPAVPERAQNDAVLAKARRSDFLFAGAALCGVGTAIAGIAFTDWRGRPAAVIRPIAGGAVAGVVASF
jgi:hypothetical protein